MLQAPSARESSGTGTLDPATDEEVEAREERCDQGPHTDALETGLGLDLTPEPRLQEL